MIRHLRVIIGQRAAVRVRTWRIAALELGGKRGLLEAGHTRPHYCLIEKIGEGGMGVVWKARDSTLDREVAIKTLPQELARDPERPGRFEREAKAVAALNHPHIVTVHSVEEVRKAEGTKSVTTELV